MTQKIYVVEGRQFRTQTDYNRAMHDKQLIAKLRLYAEKCSVVQLEKLKDDVHNGKYKFLTLLGQDFEDEIEEMIVKSSNSNGAKKSNSKTVADKKTPTQRVKTGNKKANTGNGNKEANNTNKTEDTIELFVQEELKRQEKKRRRVIILCSVLAAICLGYFGIYSYFDIKTGNSYNELNELKGKPVIGQNNITPVIHYTTDEAQGSKEVLDEYKNLLNKNKKLIGWVKIDDTNIDYPVMQTIDNEYYLDHNLNQEYDKNGSIFMDKDCDVLKPSTNFILYGHHMKSGKMFGNLHLYSDKAYYEKHPYILFDTIYEKGTYEIMYVFRSRVYSEQEIVFKYYQFIDAVSEQEFDSNMKEMAALSMYDTGVTAEYGDQLLTLSTCDYQEKDGRFVVVAKKVTKE